MIIFLNGSINAGKSTVAKLLAEKLGNTAIVEIDSLREFIDWMPIDQAIPLNLENAVSVIRNFARNDLHVIVPYPLSRKNYEYLMEQLPDYKNEIKVYTLGLSLETALSDRGIRKLDEWERERIKHHYTKGIPEPDFGVILPTDGRTPEQVMEMILSGAFKSS